MADKQTPLLTDPTGRQHHLVNDSTIIGRALDSDIVITSKRISREHAQIRREGWRVFLEDLGSTNGTYLNNERILEPMQLRDGDQIQVGDVLFTFHDPDVTYQDTPLPELEIDVLAGVVRVNRQLVSLAPKEFSLLAYLYERKGEVCSKDDIGVAVWPEYQEGVYDYQIENLMRRLRAKLEPESGEPQLLLTVRGRGYKLVLYD
ncbi:MAG: FHA domain-containing protein [Ardenticatenaceae bacterium]|nr:FHA domain-containing protein [Anaerolineales bacterium]MCB8984351.1 FHA domain-containing protein [Ardenticatenaceae bacterium]MCB8987599.1 FHA domain-containing protein [Ardenticatenaceae bacterium]